MIYYLMLENRARQKWEPLFRRTFPKAVKPGVVRLAEIGSGRMAKQQELIHGTGHRDPKRRDGQRNGTSKRSGSPWTKANVIASKSNQRNESLNTIRSIIR